LALCRDRVEKSSHRFCCGSAYSELGLLHELVAAAATAAVNQRI
jgi:hypothetical protein